MSGLTRSIPAATDGPYARLLAGVPNDPELYPHQIDLLTDRVLVTRIPLGDQSAASFLDQRALKPDTEGAWFTWSQFSKSAMAVPEGAPDYLLHLGHCGSTLLSRLVEAATGGHALREPLPLRVFAFEAADSADGAAFMTRNERQARLSLFERLWARGLGAVVKATSICNDLTDELNAAASLAFVYIGPETYIAALLAGANSYSDLRGFAQMRVRRFKTRSGWQGTLSELTGGELAALCWLTEAAAIAAASRRIHPVDFDRFLAEPAAGLAGLTEALGLSTDSQSIEKAVTGPIMGRYAKATEHPYDASIRSQILAEARNRQAGEIRVGMRWLESVCEEFPAGRSALERFGGT